jgi:hypothetical protein
MTSEDVGMLWHQLENFLPMENTETVGGEGLVMVLRANGGDTRCDSYLSAWSRLELPLGVV